MSLASLPTILQRVEAACLRSGRSPQSVVVVGASKRVAADRLEAFATSGLKHFGENYIQEGVAKVAEFESKNIEAHWHFIGALQSNKAREAVQHFELIHSVDRLSLANELDKEARKQDKIQRVLVQVNLAIESTKGGTAAEQLGELLDVIAHKQHLKIEGLMSLPPYSEDLEVMRGFHRQLRTLRDQYAPHFPQLKELSMGMSHDFEVAIEEGATIVRIGTALFGARS